MNEAREYIGLCLEEDYLMHHGVKDMHWGIRRYQNPDGSLTPLGRKRYGYGEHKRSRINEHQYKKYLKGAKLGRHASATEFLLRGGGPNDTWIGKMRYNHGVSEQYKKRLKKKGYTDEEIKQLEKDMVAALSDKDKKLIKNKNYRDAYKHATTSDPNLDVKNYRNRQKTKDREADMLMQDVYSRYAKGEISAAKANKLMPKKYKKHFVFK